jgi:hypothetical protein
LKVDLFAMKWLKRIAQGFSPGFATKSFDLKGRPTAQVGPRSQTGYIECFS